MAEKNMNAKISVEFEETANRQQLSSGDNLPTLFSKVKKFFSDLKTVAFSGSYNDLTDTPESSTPVLNTANGNPITITDGADAPLLSLNLYGKSTQDGTPTPEEPVDIVSIGDDGAVEVTACGKNLLNVNQSYEVSTVGYIFNNVSIKLLAGKTYTLSFVSSVYIDTPAVAFNFVYSDGSTGGKTFHPVKQGINIYTFTCEKAAETVKLYVNVTSAVVFSDIQIELGDTATDYEPYKGSTATITSALPLCSVDDVCDELIYNADGTRKIIKRTGVVTLDGSDDENIILGTGGDVYTSFGILDVPTPSPYTMNVMCNVTDAYNMIYGTVDNVAVHIGRAVNFNFGVNLGITTVEEAKAWFAAHPTEIIYPLAEPQEIELSVAEMSALRTLQSYSGVTNVYNDEGAEMTIKYWCDGNINALLDTKAPLNHTHTVSDISDFPESLPANGGNADTVNGLTVETAVPANAKFTDTTYSNMTAATASAAGKAGLVPAPAAGKQTSFLRGDGTWVVPTNTTYTLSSFGITATAAELNYTDGVTSNIQNQLNGKAASSHGTHVTFGTTAPAAAGTAAVGSATTVSRSDHVHPAQTTVSGNAGTATTLKTARTIDGVSFNGSAAITHYGTCSTAAATAAKTVALTGFTLVTGAIVSVKFTVTNTAASPTLNVNSTGAKAIMYRGSAISAGYLAANRVYAFVYDGTDWEFIGDVNINTTYSVVSASANGLVPMFDAADGTIDSASTDWVLTNNNGTIGWFKLPANAFKNTTYSAATTSANGLMTSAQVTSLNGKLDKSGGTMTGALIAQSNTNYTTAQVRNVTMSTEAASGGSNGQIHFQYS